MSERLCSSSTDDIPTTTETGSAVGSNSSNSNGIVSSNTLNGNANSASIVTNPSCGAGTGTTVNTHKKRICRDFLNSVCRRKQCKYPHARSSSDVTFCHDFQNNSSCRRGDSCKFLHYTHEEEEHYKKFGELPNKPNVEPIVYDHRMSLAGVSFQCPDFLQWGQCHHAKCSYLPRPPPINPNMAGKRAPPPLQPPGHRTPPPSLFPDYPNGGSWTGEYPPSPTDDEFASSLKRHARAGQFCGGPPSFKRPRNEVDNVDFMALFRRFEEELLMIRRRVESNEIKIAELRASNEYLIAQNTQLRLNSVQQQCSNVVNPVTVTQTTSQPQVMGGVSIAPVQVQATPIVSIAATPQQIIAASSGTPFELAATTSQGQQLAIAQQSITSLTSTSQSLAPTHAQQILGTSQITLTPTLTQEASMGLTINTSLPLAMSNATQPIISYPVMTHSILPH